MTEAQLMQLIAEASARYNAMSSGERAAIWREQKISFVYGQLQDCAPHMTKEDIAKLIDGD